ncbi:MAG: hypothetical protein LQ347_001816 [Umbilicaria vellea]|nr:MAG: hypothetical protein LQ347_001816 [Umbilicaria vellea]
MAAALSESGRPRILFIDAHDSFSNNIIALLMTQLEKNMEIEVTVIPMDAHIPDFPKYLKGFDAVVAGPGPGDPREIRDVGLIPQLWSLQDADLLPVFGICLGFQSLVLAFGGHVDVLRDPRHGLETEIQHDGVHIFHGLGDIKAVQYHSFHAWLGHVLPKEPVEEFPEDLFRRTRTCPQLVPLAWDATDTPSEVGYSKNPQFILMAVCHADQKKPFCGVQFHPESINSDKAAQRVVRTWWNLAKDWIQNFSPNRHRAAVLKKYEARCATKGFSRALPRLSVAKQWVPDYSEQRERAAQLNKEKEIYVTQEMVDKIPLESIGREFMRECYNSKGRAIEMVRRERMLAHENLLRSQPPQAPQEPAATESFPTPRYLSKTILYTKRALSVPAICDLLSIYEGDCILLDSEYQAWQDASGTGQGAKTGTHSIIGIVEPDTMRVEYKVGSAVVNIKRNGVTISKDLARYGGSIFTFMKGFMDRYKIPENLPGLLPLPFCGGLMGYITYEACLETIGLDNDNYRMTEADIKLNASRPDICFAFVERSIVVEHQTNNTYIQTIKKSDRAWLKHTWGILRQKHLEDPRCPELMLPYGIAGTEQQHREKLQRYFATVDKVALPMQEEYELRIKAFKQSIRRGESYELCLTNQTTMRFPSMEDSSVYEPCMERDPLRVKRSVWKASPMEWSMYLRLRLLNIAPFSAYVRLGPLTLLSTSPERFMSWDRPHAAVDADKNSVIVQNCQFRPIKGTVKKFNTNGTKVSIEEASKTLNTTKERAENLMIVDLIRHDLHGVVGAGNVTVPRLMAVEEYATVYQLVSVIEGKLSSAQTPGKNGIDVLAASLPPGSMTGAPKLRSCQILKRGDGTVPRSIYSGVLGYMCVTGRGDFSVVIRSMFKWDGSGGPGKDDWRIGAGGAITALSREQAEWDEMMLKMDSTLSLFRTETRIASELALKAQREEKERLEEEAWEAVEDEEEGGEGGEVGEEEEDVWFEAAEWPHYQAPEVEEVVDDDDLH